MFEPEDDVVSANSDRMAQVIAGSMRSPFGGASMNSPEELMLQYSGPINALSDHVLQSQNLDYKRDPSDMGLESMHRLTLANALVRFLGFDTQTADAVAAQYVAQAPMMDRVRQSQMIDIEEPLDGEDPLAIPALDPLKQNIYRQIEALE